MSEQRVENANNPATVKETSHVDMVRASIEKLRSMNLVQYSDQSLAIEQLIDKLDHHFKQACCDAQSDKERLRDIANIVKHHEGKLRYHYSSSLPNQVESLIAYYEKEAVKRIAENKKIIEDTIVFTRSVIMIVETTLMGGTHHEKQVRAEGLIALLNNNLDQLRNYQENGYVNHWREFTFSGMSDRPYRNMLDRLRAVEGENKQLKAQLNGTPAPDAPAPYNSDDDDHPF